LTVEEFAALGAMRNLQSFFLGGVSPSQFALIGVTERFHESIDRFNATFGTSLKADSTLNANPHKPSGDYRTEVGEGVYEAIAEMNALDMALYTSVLESFD